MPESLVTPQGLTGDRGWAMRDDTRQEVQSGKPYPQLMLCVARYRQDPTPGISAQWDVRRFRPNFLIETPPGMQGLVEQGCVGRTLRIGEVVLEISAPTPRCGMTTRLQDDLPFDRTILRTIVKEGAQNLGVGAHVHVAGKARAGDLVELID